MLEIQLESSESCSNLRVAGGPKYKLCTKCAKLAGTWYRRPVGYANVKQLVDSVPVLEVEAQLVEDGEPLGDALEVHVQVAVPSP